MATDTAATSPPVRRNYWQLPTFALGAADPKVLIPLLSLVPPGEEVEGERRRLLADTCRRLDPPDLRRAAEEIGTYLQGQSRLSPDAVARLWLTLAETHVALNEPAK